jgi:hypothetical protein
MKRVNAGGALVAVGALVLAVPSARAAGETSISVSDADRSAASAAKVQFLKAKRQSNLPPGQDSTALRRGGVTKHSHEGGDSDRSHNRYPGDLFNNGGPTLPSVAQHGVFVNPPSSCGSDVTSCWGNPLGFLSDYSKSEFVHVTDQYVNAHGRNRYPVGDNFEVTFTPPPSPLTDNDMAAIAHAAAVYSGEKGYGHVFHIFLPPGQDICFDSSFTTCYSPDFFPTFFFCAYHSSVVFSDIGEVIYTVEPFQDVGGCSVRPGTPNGQLTDSTNNVLSHELTETITDPDGDAWWNLLDNGLYGQEIGDECSFITFTPTNVYFDPSNVVLNGRPYSIQPEYSNKGHTCAVDGAEGD